MCGEDYGIFLVLKSIMLHCCRHVSSTVVEACGDDYGFSLCSIVSISGPIFNKQDAQGVSNHLCPNADKENIMGGKKYIQKIFFNLQGCS